MITVPSGGKYCVYTHSINGEVFYVGMGISTRPMARDSRNPEWIEWVRGKDYQVAIASWHLDRGEARKAEADLIQSLKPRCNVVGLWLEGLNEAAGRRGFTPKDEILNSIASLRIITVNGELS